MTAPAVVASRLRTEWRPIPGFDGYDVSSDGQVRSWLRSGTGWDRLQEPRIRAQRVNTTGRLQVGLAVRGRMIHRSVHRLVAAAFIGPCPDGQEVCHNNGDPLDNRVENLRYGTPKENEADKVLHGTSLRGERHHQAKVTVDQVLQIRDLYRRGLTPAEIVRLFPIGRGGVNDIVSRRSWAWLADEEEAAS